jgi:anti-sigma regulatory factor (Ser/Thr protein kinase)
MEGRDVIARHPTGATQELAYRRENAPGGLSHAALLYRDPDEYLSQISDFIRAADAPVQAVLPWSNMLQVRAVLPVLSAGSLVADMTELGRNPARLIAAGLAFADEYPAEPVRCLWEPAWPGRSAAELNEVARHEALCNLAFADRKMTLLCLYDASRLSQETISWVESTHPVVIAAGRERAGLYYSGAGVLPPGSDDPLPEAAPGAESLGFTDRLAALRVFAARLGPARTRDLTLAVSEIAANALAHATGGLIRAWRAPGELICQLEDSGQIKDPLAGYRQRSPELPGGHGLRLVNLVCDLVERRTGPAGTVTRLHMRTDAG